jgi:NADP-dependent 3-hydroxy acid dehydrogenase YdfG
VISSCDSNKLITSKVTWQVRDHSIDHVKVMVVDPGASEGKLFSEGGFTGEAETGEWVKLGMRFDLLRADSGAKLATYTVTQEACKSH